MQIRKQLALSLHAIICQQLVPAADATRRQPAIELLLANYAVRNHIRRNQLENLYNELVLGKRHGMISFEQSLADLVKSGAISVQEARLRAPHAQELEGLLPPEF